MCSVKSGFFIYIITLCFLLPLLSFSNYHPDTLHTQASFKSTTSVSVKLPYNDAQLAHKKPNPFFKLLQRKQRKSKRFTAALLAFPFPFGIVGLHRIYLGTSPWVPVAYIASLGGIFGILPLIDFCVLLLDKNTEHYQDNGKVFMWIR